MPRETYDKLNEIESIPNVKEALESLLDLPGYVQFEKTETYAGREFSFHDIEEVFEGNKGHSHMPRLHEDVFKEAQVRTPLVLDVGPDTYIVTYNRHRGSSLGPYIKVQEADRI